MCATTYINYGRIEYCIFIYVNFSLEDFRDLESGIWSVLLGVGTTPTSDDSIPFRLFNTTNSYFDVENALTDGFSYYVIVKVR